MKRKIHIGDKTVHLTDVEWDQRVHPLVGLTASCTIDEVTDKIMESEHGVVADFNKGYLMACAFGRKHGSYTSVADILRYINRVDPSCRKGDGYTAAFNIGSGFTNMDCVFCVIATQVINIVNEHYGRNDDGTTVAAHLSNPKAIIEEHTNFGPILCRQNAGVSRMHLEQANRIGPCIIIPADPLEGVEAITIPIGFCYWSTSKTCHKDAILPRPAAKNVRFIHVVTASAEFGGIETFHAYAIKKNDWVISVPTNSELYDSTAIKTANGSLRRPLDCCCGLCHPLSESHDRALAKVMAGDNPYKVRACESCMIRARIMINIPIDKPIMRNTLKWYRRMDNIGEALGYLKSLRRDYTGYAQQMQTVYSQQPLPASLKESFAMQMVRRSDGGLYQIVNLPTSTLN